MQTSRSSKGFSRRRFLKTGSATLAASLSGFGLPVFLKTRPPNFLLLITDQQSVNALSAHGNSDVHTPNADRLVQSGTSFRESYTAFPLCSPARSSILTGRMPSETGVVRNNRAIHPSIPNIGQWLAQQGYQTVYSGKWHLPHSYTNTIPGFHLLPAGIVRQGQTGDSAVSRACQAYLFNRSGSSPFFLVASFLQPHDICDWVGDHFGPKGWESEPKLEGTLPSLPANFHFDSREPQALRKRPRPQWSEEQWRFYLWSYYRHVEMADAEVGRVLDAVADTGLRENTIIIMISDHGEGGGHHQKVLKNFLYDEAAKVPLILSCPNRIPVGRQDQKHLVSNVDIMPTLCHYAGVKAPDDLRGQSLRPLMENTPTEWREFLAAEVAQQGSMIRTPGYKYVSYEGDPVEQLFDMRSDPGETRNLAVDSAQVSILADHQKLLRNWKNHLQPAARD